MRLAIAAICDRGKIRSGNEDNLFVNGMLLPEIHGEAERIDRQLSSAKRSLFGVFDGMGGYASGETASFLAASATEKLWTSKGGSMEPESLLLRICEAANEDVCREMTQRNVHMGTTAALLLVRGKRYHLCNVGDSPIFLLRDGKLMELSREHTERATYEAVTGTKSDPKKKFNLTQNIGMFTDDLVMEPYCDAGKLHAGDTFLLCSDGVTDMLDRETIQELLGSSDVNAAAESLVAQALEAGGRDNITAICIRCEKGGALRLFGKAKNRRER